MSPLSRDLRDPRWMVLKGALFVLTGTVASALIVAETMSLKVAGLLALTVWAFARAYYFAFHVVERYIDGRFRYRGLLSLIRYWWSRRDQGKGPPTGSEAGPSAP